MDAKTLDPLNFQGRRVLVAGGSSGIGNGIAQAFRARGADVHVWGTRGRAEDYAGVEGSDLTGLGYTQVDLAEPRAAEGAEAPFGGAPIDNLILSQGVVAYNREEFEAEGWDRVMAVNLGSVMDACRRFRGALAEAGGSVTIVSSVAGFQAAKGNPAYAASKAGAVSLTKTLAQAWAEEGIRVNGLAPGFVETKLTTVTTEHPKRRAATLSAIPLRRFGTPEDMAGAALFLASPLAAYMTGQTLIVDGGLTL
jgi:3-oxoacyl-[acyl-carrier protein] reductase